MATSGIVVEDSKLSASHVEEKMSGDAIEHAKLASDAEHNTTIWEAIKVNKKAVIWSMLISMSIVMEGYDVILIGNFFGYPAFQRKYGEYRNATLGYQLSGPWQIGLNMGSTVGTVFGMSVSH